MRTTMNLDDDLLATAMEYSGIKERATVVRMALEQFVAIEAERRLARLKGSLPDLKAPPRRRAPNFRNPD
jgi:Arc/MetJ family transcription regulator